MFDSFVLCVVESCHVLKEICLLRHHRAYDAEDFGHFNQGERSAVVLRKSLRYAQRKHV